MVILICEPYQGRQRRILCKNEGEARAWPFENTDISLDAEWELKDDGHFGLEHHDHNTYYSFVVKK